MLVELVQTGGVFDVFDHVIPDFSDIVFDVVLYFFGLVKPLLELRHTFA